MEKSIKSSAINYGLYLGAALSLVTVAIYAINLDLMVNMWLGIVLLIVVVAVGVVSTAKSKSLQNGFISFKDALGSYVLTVAIGILISTLVSYILFNFIDPEAAVYLQEKTVEVTVSMMEGFNVPAEAIAEAVEQIENTNQYGIGTLVKNFFIGMIIQIIIGLIVAAIMKKNEPIAE